MQQDNNKNKMTRIFLNVYITSLLLFVDFIVENNVLFMNKTTKRHQQQWIILKVYLIAQFLEKKWPINAVYLPNFGSATMKMIHH